jgi:outer membrane protein OmpA-like peptidoglycan-associated protein
MKRVLLYFFFMYGWIHPSFSQDNIALPTQNANNAVETPETVAKTTTFTENTPVSHWSVGIKGGINYFRISASTINRTDQFHLTLGGMVEYTINPLVGLGVEYMNNPYGCRTNTVDITGGTNDAVLFGSINLSNLLLPNRSGKSKFDVYGKGGFGFAFYNFSLDHAGTQTDQSAMVTLALNVEYNLSRSLSLGLEGQYRYYNWKLEQVNTTYNTETANATIGLRYKFGATGKKQHARNISLSAYNPAPAPILIEKPGKDNTAETLDRVKALEDENAELMNTIKDMKNDILALSTKEKPESNATFKNIEFEFGSDKLAQSAYPVLDQVADMLKSNSSSVNLSVAGYTDYIGTAEYNLVLSVKRANTVKKYLLSKNVPASRISISGYGKENPIAPNSTVEGRQRNRRVEFQLTK